jgi:hypothetical protein
MDKDSKGREEACASVGSWIEKGIKGHASAYS